MQSSIVSSISSFYDNKFIKAKIVMFKIHDLMISALKIVQYSDMLQMKMGGIK